MKTINKPQSFNFRITVENLERISTCLEFHQMVENEELKWDDEIQVNYDLEEDLLTAVVVDGNLSFGHIFDPTSFEIDPDLVIELSKIK